MSSYIATQVFNEMCRDKHVIWNAGAADRIVSLAESLKSFVFEDDIFCDFGGGDGQAADAWRQKTRCRSIVFDCTPGRLAEAKQRGLEVMEGRLEKLPFADASVQWGMCSHILEHVESLEDALAELRRVVACGLLVVVPLENDEQAKKTVSHVRHNPSDDWWCNKLSDAGFTIVHRARTAVELTTFITAPDYQPN